MEEDQRDAPWSKETVIRLLYVVLYALIYAVAEVVVAAVVILQFGFKLVTGNINDRLNNFSASLNRFIYQILEFATFRSDEKPFPLGDWPEPESLDGTSNTEG